MKAEEAVRSLERLVSDHHRKLYSRDKNYSVLSEEEVPIEKIASEILSTGTSFIPVVLSKAGSIIVLHQAVARICTVWHNHTVQRRVRKCECRPLTTISIKDTCCTSKMRRITYD